MEERRILGLNESMVTNTCGPPVVLHTTSSRIFPCIELNMNHSPVMYDPSQVPNIFSGLVTWCNPLRPNYDCEIQMHPNQEFDHLRLGYAPVVTTLNFSSFECIDLYPIHFNVTRFCRVQADDNELQVATFWASITTHLFGQRVRIVEAIVMCLVVALVL